MSAILLGLKHQERISLEDNESTNKNEDNKEQIIEGKNKTYVISKTLGKGTFGKVKLAYNINNKNEKYACKILLKSNIKDEDDYIRCKREMEILKRMHHVNVVRTYEIISNDTVYYIFMDFCAKGELFNYIVDQQHLSEEKSAFFYYQIINGIEYIHNKGVCHRDLKPENLLLTEKMKLKIIDFGLSNFFSGNLLETPCGSPCYASPEMVMGKKYNGFCIDIWSSGIILYAMLCGYLPFEEVENDEYNEVLFKNIVECNVEYPSEFITPVAKDLLKRILVKDPKKRITIDEIKQHNFYLLGELLYKQTFEGPMGLKDYELFFIDDKKDYFDKNSYFEEFKNNENDENINKENKNSNSVFKNNEDKNKSTKEDKNKTTNKNNNGDLTSKDIELNSEKSIKENIKNNISKDKENHDKSNKNDLVIKETINNDTGGDKNINNKRIKNENNENTGDSLIKKIPKISNNDSKNSNNNKKKENNKLKISYNSNKIKAKDKKEDKKSPQKEKINILKVSGEELKKLSNKELKELSSPNYNNAQLLTYDNQKIYDNSIEKVLNLKNDQNLLDEKEPKKYASKDNHNININNKKSTEINFHTHYLNTEVYPINNRSKNKRDYYQYKILNKKSLKDNKITFNNILKSLQNKYNFKSKTPNRYTIKKKVTVKKNILSDSISKTKSKYCSQSPGIKKFGKINNDIHLKIEKNFHFQRQTNLPLTTHNNNNKNKNAFYLLNNNILKYFNNNFNTKNQNFKPNKKFSDKDNNTNNNKNNINLINKKNQKKLDNYYIFNEKNYVKTISNGINIEKELSKNAINKALNFKSFEYCLSSNTSKKKHLIVEEKPGNNNNNNNNNKNIYYNNFNKNKNQKIQISKKSLGNLNVENTYLPNTKSENAKPVLINSHHIRTNTEILNNNKIKNPTKNKVNLSTKKQVKVNSKMKKNEYHNLISHNQLKYMNNIDNDNDNNIIINLNILKPNIFLDQQKSSKKAKINKTSNNVVSSRMERPMTESNYCSTMRNNNFYNSVNKNKYKNYKNIDTNQIKKSKEINKIIKSIHKIKGNYNTNNSKRINTEIYQMK
jgi:serine/threonine protein kinase